MKKVFLRKKEEKGGIAKKGQKMVKKGVFDPLFDPP